MLILGENACFSEDLTKFSTINWHIPIYCTIFAPMKDRTKIFASLFRKWRKEQNITYYQIKREEGDDIRVDQIARIEKGQEVTTKKLLACVHFCNAHGYDILNDVWSYKETPSNTEKKEIKIDTETELKQPKETLPSGTSMDGAQTPLTGTENSFTRKDTNEVSEEEYGEPSESEQAEWDYGLAQLKFKDGEQLDKVDQLHFIRNGRCPRCGKSQFVEKTSTIGKKYTKCQNYSCGYWFRGTIHNPTLSEDYQNGVTPLGPKK